MSKVLILSASFGEGHNAAARNLREALVLRDPEGKAVISDPFLETYGDVNRFFQKAYVSLINNAPALWQMAFDALDRTRVVERHMVMHGSVERMLFKLLDDLKPDVVVSTYPGCNHLLDHMYRRRLTRPFVTATIVTDSLTINSVWYRAFSDYFIVANTDTEKVMLEAGVPAAKLRTLGFPVPRTYGEFSGLRVTPPANGKWKVLYVINSGRGLAPSIVHELLKLDNIELSVTVGRDEKLGDSIRDVAAKSGHEVEIHGWTPHMPRLMAESHLVISKAGGATVQETLAAKTPMIITQIVPGQEEGNARLLIENDAGALATTPADIASTVFSAFADGGARWNDWLFNVEKLSRPNASDEVAEFILGLSR